MIRRRIRHTKRYQEIINAFIRNGFSHFLFRFGLTERVFSDSEIDVRTMNLKDIGIKLRHTLQQLGPTFIKIGQIVSTRRDIVPEAIALELEKLQDEVEPFSVEQVREIIETELDDKIENLFASFIEEPLATASIGQVHVAQLFSGEEVAIKVQRPDIKQKFNIDLDILQTLGQLLEERIEWAKRHRIQEIIDEYTYSLRNELDYTIEGVNSERIWRQFSDQPFIHIPKIYWDYSTDIVLTMERIRGIKINHVDQLDDENYDRKMIAKRLTDAMLKQVLEEGFFHGDPHAGNIYIMPNNVIAFLDFGMVGTLTDSMKYHFASLIIDLRSRNSEGIIKTFDSMGILDEKTNIERLLHELEQLKMKYYNIPLHNISLGKLMMEIFTIAYRHQIRVPTDITILAKVILTLESIVSKLDPELSIMKAVEPFGKKLIKKRYHPKTVIRQAVNDILENIEIIANLPKDLKNISSTIQKGKIRLDIHIMDIQSFLRRLDKISNRLSFSIILLSFSILMAGIIIGASIAGQTTLLWNLPVIEIGSIIATLMFLFMMFSIIRSGRM